MGKLRQWSTEKERLEDESVIKQRDSKGVGSWTSIKAKLPKLVITKFNGTHTDWIRFWNQFEAEINKSNLLSISKFSYWKEILEPKVHLLVDGLPFNTESYNQVKNNLTSRYGKVSEVVNGHVQAIITLPIVHDSNPIRIHECYKKLMTHVQSLETMGKPNQIEGHVRNTLDKLPQILSDFVRPDGVWQQSDFSKLIDALRQWVERNPVTETGKEKGTIRSVKNFNTHRKNA